MNSKFQQLFKVITLLLLCSVSANSFSQNRKVNLLKNEPFEKVVQMAKKEKKLLFLDFGSPRCSPCLYMKNNIFTIDSVADFVNERFISVDYTEGPEKERLSRIYLVSTEPVFLLVDTAGNLLHRTEGRSTAGEMLERFRQGIDKSNNLAAQNRRFDGGDRDGAFLLEYVKTLHIAGLREKKAEVLGLIFNHEFPLEQLKKVDYWTVYSKYDDSPVSRQTLFVMDNMEEFSRLFGEKQVHSKIENLYASRARVYIFGKKAPADDPEYKTVVRYAQKTDHPNATKWLVYLVPAGYKFSDWVQMAKEIDNALSFNIFKGEERYTYMKMMSEQLAWYCNDVNALPYALKWIDSLLQMEVYDKKESVAETRKSVTDKIAKLSR
ncbi:MAG: thioredoxin fold domain-containing protein [Bacteroidales bacterium]